MPDYPCRHWRNHGCPVQRIDIPGQDERLDQLRDALSSRESLTREEAAQLLPPEISRLPLSLRDLALERLGPNFDCTDVQVVEGTDPERASISRARPKSQPTEES